MYRRPEIIFAGTTVRSGMKKAKPTIQPDLEKINAQYAATYEKLMTEALKQIDELTRKGEKVHEEALDELAAAREEKKRIIDQANVEAAQAIEKHRAALEETIRKKVMKEVAELLLEAGRSVQEVHNWLSVPLSVIGDVLSTMRFERLGDSDARVTYEQQGRGGTIIFQLDSTVLRFGWEFGGGNALALVFIPDEDQWEAQTGLLLTQRMPVLDFIGTHIIADQGGRSYGVEGNALVIYR